MNKEGKAVKNSREREGEAMVKCSERIFSLEGHLQKWPACGRDMLISSFLQPFTGGKCQIISL